MIPLPTSPRPREVLLAAVLLMLAAACKPRTASTQDQPSSSSPPDRPSPVEAGGASRPPTADEVTGFLRSVTPPTAHLISVKMEPPARMPNTSPADHAWIANVKLTLAHAEDLFGPPARADAQAFAAVTSELDGLVRWHDAFVRSSYARLYPDFDLKPPAAPNPRLIARLHKADEPFPPMYGRVEAVWQVDRWNFAQDLPDPPEAGQPRSAFPGPCVVQGSPEAQAFLAAARTCLAQAQPAKAALESRYAADVAKATQPGTIYRGQLAHHGAVTAAEVRFIETSRPDPQSVPFELRLPARPGYVFSYSAKLAQRMPIHPAPAVAGEEAPTPAGTETPEPAPKGDLTVSFVSAAGKEGVLDGSVPTEMLNRLRHFSPPGKAALGILEHRLQGSLIGDGGEPGRFVLSTQQVP